MGIPTFGMMDGEIILARLPQSEMGTSSSWSSGSMGSPCSSFSHRPKSTSRQRSQQNGKWDNAKSACYFAAFAGVVSLESVLADLPSFFAASFDFFSAAAPLLYDSLR